MSKSSDLSSRRSAYYAFKERITSVASQIKSVIDEMDNTKKNISEAFIVDGESGDNYKLKEIQMKLQEKYNLLTSNTIPAIETKINSLTNGIETALREEAEERERALEAAKTRVTWKK